jgi:hypothetical protein
VQRSEPGIAVELAIVADVGLVMPDDSIICLDNGTNHGARAILT